VEFVCANRFLTEQGLLAPDFPFLRPNMEYYSTLLLQPEGTVQIQETYIGPGQNHQHHQRLIDFFRIASEESADLVATPEYCCSLETLNAAIQSGYTPYEGQLWVIGIEAVTSAQLTDFAAGLDTSFQFLQQPNLHSPPGKFLDPIFYLFLTRGKDGNRKTVILAQFKTSPMVDHHDIERRKLTLGTQIFVFNKDLANKIKLATIICSDSISEDVRTGAVAIHNRCLLLHLQLNPNPRRDSFKRYRDLIFEQSGSEQTEVLCLNWSANVQSNPAGPFTGMTTCGTALYMKSKHVDEPSNDTLVDRNHRLGLYNTYWADSQVYSFFFNFEPAVYKLQNRKTFQDGMAVAVRKNGPEMLSTLQWAAQSNSWSPIARMPDRFPALCTDIDPQRLQPFHEDHYHSLNTERLINFSIGNASDLNWFRVSQLKTFRIDAAEKICRITFAQDRDQLTKAARNADLSTFSNLLQILSNRQEWPIWMQRITGDVALKFRPHTPNRNLVGPGGFEATAVYSKHCSAPELAALFEKLETLVSPELLRNPSATQTIAIWYHQNGQDHLFRREARPTILDNHEERSADIDRSGSNG